MTVDLFFDKGSLLLKNVPADLTLPEIAWDERVNLYRAPAEAYRTIVLTLHRQKIPFNDEARAFEPLELPLAETIEPRIYQQDAVNAWWRHGRRGVVVLPTGAGKTVLAVLLIAKTGRPTLIHVPTLDLMHQWKTVLMRYFSQPIGLLGGGFHEVEHITVTTYDSALIHVPHLGNRFGLAIFDECHHLPGEQYRFLAVASIAPFRLGLTATPERNDGRESMLYNLLGPLCYRGHIHEMTGGALAPYEVVTIEVTMKPDEREAYEAANQHYRDFLREEQIDMSRRGGWKSFLWKASRTPEGRRAFKAWQTQKRLSQASSAKEEWVWDLIREHHQDRMIIFTHDNESAYRIGRRFLLPVLTHQTRPKEREAFLEHFRTGTYSIMVTSRVLNEGVDVPEANIAIVVSGSGSVREHVQRLGRILRGKPGKKAILYELISEDTREFYVNRRRRRHLAYERPGPIQGS